eukprot:4538655-Prymnesium_polylepis.1
MSDAVDGRSAARSEPRRLAARRSRPALAWSTNDKTFMRRTPTSQCESGRPLRGLGAAGEGDERDGVV